MLAWILETLMVTTLLAAVAALACVLLRRRPGLCHALWWMVLVRFLTPAPPVHWRELLPRWVEPGSPAIPGGWLALAVAPPGAATPSPGHPVVLLAGIWLLGSLLLAVRFWMRSREIARCVRLGAPAGAELLRRVREAAARLGVRAPAIRVLEGLGSPFLWGVRRPVLLWPAAPWNDLEVDSVLLHELAHLRRRDPWTSWAELLVKVLWWWNPVAWWALRQVQEWKEQACDGHVLASLPEARRQYARLLLSTALREPACGVGSVALLGAQDRRSVLKRRLRALYREPALRPAARGLRAAVALLFLASLPGWLRPAPAPRVEDAEPAAGATEAPAPALASAPDPRVLERFGATSLAEVEHTCRERVQANDQDGEAFHFLAWSLAYQGRLEEAMEAFERQDELGYAPSFARYNLACCAAQLGDEEAALSWLEGAADSGLGSWEQVRDDPDLESLRDHPDFQRLLERFRSNPQ